MQRKGREGERGAESELPIAPRRERKSSGRGRGAKTNLRLSGRFIDVRGPPLLARPSFLFPTGLRTIEKS